MVFSSNATKIWVARAGAVVARGAGPSLSVGGAMPVRSHSHQPTLPGSTGDVDRAVLDPLEARRMLSVSVSKGGTLSVVGTNHSDTIYVQMHRHDAKHVDVYVDGTTTTVSTAGVKSIVVNGGARDDTITLSDRNGAV